jgi:hypothetical protein
MCPGGMKAQEILDGIRVGLGIEAFNALYTREVMGSN